MSALPLRDAEGVFVIPPRHSDLRLNIVDMGANSMHSHAIRYYIRSGRSERVVEASGRTLGLNMLSEGNDYQIYAAAYKPDGTWTRKQQIASLTISGYWWKTWWAITICLLSVIMIVALWLRHIEQVRSRRAEARIEAWRNNTMERELAFLVNTNYALRTPLTLIYAPVKLLLENIRDKRRPDDMEETLENVYRNTKRMRDTIDMALSLHNVSKAPEGKQVVTHDVNRSIIRARYADASATPPAAMSNADESFVMKVEKIVAAGLADEDFGVDNVVEAMAMGRSAFYARFRAITGQTIGQYIAARRLVEARRMLADPALTVAEVAARLGFGSQRYFSTFFRQQTGMSPSAFRKSALENGTQ